MIHDIFSNKITYIIIEIAIASITAFCSILVYGKTKKLQFLFFILAALTLYIKMIFSVLYKLDIFNIAEYGVYDGIPIIENIVNFSPYLFLLFGFIVILLSKKNR